MDNARTRRLFCIGRFGREDGATAILIALLTLFVFLPLTGVATSTFIRSGAITELQLAADAGALAGAASIPVGKIEFLATYLSATADPDGDLCEPVPAPPEESPVGDLCTDPNDEINEEIEEISPGLNPLEIACDQALAALDSNGQIGNSFDPDFDPGNPQDSINCDPRYVSDLNFATEFGDCFEWVTGDHEVTDTVDAIVDEVPGVPAEITNEITDLQKVLVDTLPGLLRPGIKVILTRGVTPPLEFLIDPDNRASDQHEVVSYARRRFKNAIVLPIVPGVTVTVGDPPTSTVDDPPTSTVSDDPSQEIDLSRTLSPALDLALEDFFENWETLASEFPPECQNVIPALHDDFVDVANPQGEDASDTLEMLEDARRDPGNPNALLLVIVEGTPFFDFFPVCVDQSDGNFVGSITGVGCAANAPGAFRAALVPG